MSVIRNFMNLLTGSLLSLVAAVGVKHRQLTTWLTALGDARNYSRHLARHKADNGSWNQLRYTSNGYRYGGIVSTGAVA